MRLVVDASVAIKVLVGEPDSGAAVEAYRSHHFLAPELLLAECANILWKKVRRGELSADEGLVASRLLQAMNIDLYPMRSLVVETARWTQVLDHPAYDCIYLALAASQGCALLTADKKLAEKVRRLAGTPQIMLLSEALA